MPKSGYKERRKFNSSIQEVAVQKGLYSKVWPDYHLISIDSLPDGFAKTVDIGGGDIAFFARDGHLIFVGHRFRNYSYLERGYVDFTVRESEYRRHLHAVNNSGFLPGYYACGYANESRDDLVNFIIVKYREIMEDIAVGLYRLRFKKTVPGQENFYYVSFNDIPIKYVVYRYPENGRIYGLI